MSTARRALAAVTLLVWTLPVQAIDLTKIERTIHKEPAYQSKNPQYGLIVFGHEGKSRAWIVQDGDLLYVDRNCNGDLTEAGNCLPIKKKWELNRDPKQRGKWIAGDNVRVPISEPDGTKHLVAFRRTSTGVGLAAQSLGGRYVGATYREDLVLGDRPASAPIVHLNGPLTFHLADAPKTWAPGETIEFVVLFGTPGLGKGTFAYPIQSFKLRPLAEIQFPAKAPGDPPIVTRVRLTACSRAGFIGG
jgi:hypothetical protein